MRPTSRLSSILLVLTLLAAALAVSCKSGSGARAADDDDFESDIVLEPAEPAGADHAVAADVAAFAQQMQSGLAEQKTTTEPSLDVQWLDVTPSTYQPRPAVAALQGPAEISQAPVALESAAVVQPAVLAAPAAVVVPTHGPLERAELLRQLHQAIGGDDAAPFAVAARLTLLSVIDPAARVDPAVLAELSAAQRRRIERFEQFLRVLAGQVADESASLDASALAARFAETLGAEPITIQVVKLVRRVSGYGVYDEFPDNRFLAGRENALIIYVELDHFQTQPTPEDQFQVKLAQEVELYTDPSGTLVWAQPREELLDESRNRRRDFFIRQLIKLPANLSVGEYLIKVRVFDTHGGTVSERSVPIVLVADQRMVREK